MRWFIQAARLSAMLMASSVPAVPVRADDSTSTQLETARAEVIKLMEGTRISDADIAMSIPLAPVNAALALLNAVPEEQRTISVNSTGANGFFWKDDPTWCGSFAELGSPDGLRAAVVLSTFGLEIPDASSIVTNVNAALSLQRADVHWHFRGRRVSGPFGIGNVCPPGGGVGGHIGGRGETSFTLRTLAHLSQDATDGGFRYDLSLISPAVINMTLSIGFEHIGDLGIPQSFDVPQGVLLSGKIPLLFQTSGTVQLPGGTSKNYAVAIVAKSLGLTPAAVSGLWTGTVEFKPGS